MKRIAVLLVAGLCAALLMMSSAHAHDSINAEARKNYIAKLQEFQSNSGAALPAVVRAKSLYHIGVTLDEVRELFNEDMISHGVVKGLETSLLLNELARIGYKLETSPKTGLYLSQLQYYRDALRLDPHASYTDHARYMLLKSHFYDSFSDNPLTPFSQSKQTLAEMIALGEGLMKSKHTQVDREELRFVLGMHYLQAIRQQHIDKETGLKKVRVLIQELRKDHPDSLKLLTLEALLP